MSLNPPGAEETRVAHSFFLSFLSECGIVGGLAAGLWLLQPLLLVLGWRSGRLSVRDEGYALAVFCGLTGWLLHGLADFNVYIPGSVMLVSCLPAMAFDAPPADVSATRRQRRRIVLLALGLIAVAGLWRLPGERAYQLLAAEAQARELNWSRLRRKGERAGRLLWRSPYPLDILGKAAQHLGDHRRAVAAFEEAIRRTPHRAAFHAHLAESQLALGDVAAAQHSVASALAWYPHNPKYRKLAERIRARAPDKSGNTD
jgi:hypothetical protein